jgi:hypothetical protein
MANFGPGDLATIGVFSGAGWATGFFGCKFFHVLLIHLMSPGVLRIPSSPLLIPLLSNRVARLQLRAPNARFLGGVGLMAGFFYAYMSSTQRLMGLQENDAEVRRYTAMSEEDIAKFAKRSHQANIELINTVEKK